MRRIPAAAPRPPRFQFNEQFRQHPRAARLDVSRFDTGNVAVPGSYRVDLYVNQTWLGRLEVTLRQTGDDVNNVQPCFNRVLLERIGVDLSKLSPQATALITQDPATSSQSGAQACVLLQELVPAAAASFDIGEQRMDISVPQVAMSRQARGYVNPRY